MMCSRPAVHRTVIVVDVGGFGDRGRASPDQVVIRDGVYGALRDAFGAAGLAWPGCRHEDRGVGVFVLAPAEIPERSSVELLPPALVDAVRERSKARCGEERIRLRMALHAGEIIFDGHGAASSAINLAFRLLQARPVKAALATSSGVLAVIASSWFYDEVIRHSPPSILVTYRPTRVAVKETRTIAWISVPDNPDPLPHVKVAPVELAGPVPRQLPAHIPHFVGRAEELRQITALLDTTTRESDTVVISAINGTAGIGKSALAVHWAHHAAEQFPDGQLYVNLRGFDPTNMPMKPAEAIRTFLDAFEIPPQRIPVSLDAQAALYRTLLAGRRVLVVLDNARDVEQVRPLLPGSSTCRVLITSRNQLASLIAQEGVYPVTLDVLSADEAVTLLARRLGDDRITTESDAVAELVDYCARLPLALAVVAARASLNRGLPLRILAGELRGVQVRLDALDGGDPATSVRAVFSWSYQQLKPSAARMFRLLGLHPGPDISLPAAASLVGLDQRGARDALGDLVSAHLVTQHTPGRYAFHDLLRTYAAEQAHALDARAGQRTAVCRLLDHYLHTSHAAGLLIQPAGAPIVLASPHSGVTLEPLADHRQALAWCETEYPVLLAAIRLAAASGDSTRAWQLAWELEEFMERKGHWHDRVTVQRIALAVTERSGDRLGQAHSHCGLGRACPWIGLHDEAHMHLQQALALFEELGDLAGQVDAHIRLGAVFEQQGRIEHALPHAQQALALSKAAGYRKGQSKALNNIGWYSALLGAPEQALIFCQQSLAIKYELGDRRGEANTLDSLGYAHHLLGHYQQAIDYYEQALAVNREIGTRYGQAAVLSHLGDTYCAANDLDKAGHAWQEALDILDLHIALGLGQSAGFPDAQQIRAKLHHIPRQAISNLTVQPD